jgi:group II intron reverse transcriptase/maturase
VNPTGEAKVHSLIDKVYHPTNLRLAWEKVRKNAGSGGIDRVTLDAFERDLDAHLAELYEQLRNKTYQPLPVLRVYIPKAGNATKLRPLGIPAVRDRIVQQALLQRLDPIFAPDLDDASFGYRVGRSTKDALAKVWREIQAGSEWIVDADLSDFFGTVDHDKLLTLLNRRIADGRVLGLVRQFLAAGYQEGGQWHPSERGTPQGGVISPLLSNLLLTPFDKEMRRKRYQLTRYADDWLVTCRTRQVTSQCSS